MEIRPGTVDDVARLQEIEIAAGAAFVEVGRPEIAGDDPLPVETLTGYIDADRCWVIGDPVVAYVVVDLLDDVVHIEQVSVHPDAARQGLGARLIDHVGDPVTLTTFADVPWNAPYYERLGFVVIPNDAMGPELCQRMDDEHAHGLLRSERVAMVRRA